ncbi:MAG: hypothetical protein JNL70_08925 [Saprospiraceae bacterium]|nr:hypothetical protein [Saprospiraceae bacterium]
MKIENSEKQLQDEKPPIFKTWRQMYIFVLVFHALVIAAFYVFTKMFS